MSLPPFSLTSRILNLVSDISTLLGRHEGLQAPIPKPKLRRQNRIRSIQSSLAIEGNTLDLNQVTAIFDQRRVIGPKKDILEVQNAIALYEGMKEFDFTSHKSLLKAHSVLMKGLVPDHGKFRSGSVGIMKGSVVSHVAPQAKQVSKLVGDLFDFLKKEKDLSPLIKASVFHYEFEFIHPFSDGNGRMGRFWQTLILTEFNSVFEFIPIESSIRKKQAAYYKALEASDQKGESTIFIEFSLEMILESLKEFLSELKPATVTPLSRMERARSEFQGKEFSRIDYLRLFKTISSATASRDLAMGVKKKLVRKRGTKATTTYIFLT